MGDTDLQFTDKYHLTSEQSKFLAKKKLDENIYCGMKMEARAVTFPQTQTILNGVNVPEVQLDDIQAILNMRDVWRFLLSTLDEPVTLDYLCKLNEFITRNEALEVFVWGTRGQFFWDGNKRTSMTLANKILVSAGAGILTITDKRMENFNLLMLDYYNTGDSHALKAFLYENAIQGMEI